jgi:anti-sigma factor RsiW
MECREVQELLSAYHDNELSPEVRAKVARHVEDCSHCSEELAVFGQLSIMAKELDDPEPPQHIWAGIEAALGAESDSRVVQPVQEKYGSRRKWRLGILTAAAMVLVAIGILWVGGKGWRMPGPHNTMAADFVDYLEHFASNPQTAHNVLLAKYDGQKVNVTEATKQLGYRPVVADGLPQGYSLEAMYVMEMPCCTCVQSVCRRSDGKVFALFEHDEAQPVWYGNCSRIETQCDGRSCSLIQADRTLVASWKTDNRQLTVVGADDLDEIADLMDHFGSRSPNS